MDTKLKMAVQPVKYATEAERLVGWIKVANREHWLVRCPDGTIIGEIFQVQGGHQYYALVYGRIYPSHSGCATSVSLRELTTLMTGVALNRKT